MSQGQVDWRAVVAACPSPLFVAASDGELLFVSPSLRAALPGAAQARTMAELLDPKASSGAGLIAKAEASPAPPLKFMATLSDGRPALLCLSALAGREQVIGEIRLADEESVSRSDQLEGLVQKARALGHDMNQPLTVIMGQAEILLLKAGADDNLSQRLQQVISEAERLEEMTHQLSTLVHSLDQG